MAFSSGTFSLASGNPVVTGTTVSSTWANNTLTDIATGLTTCLLKDGTQTATGAVPFAQGIVGTATNNNATALNVGEYIESIVATPSTGLTSNTELNITSISLTAGDWDVGGIAIFRNAGSTSLTWMKAGASTTSVTLGAESTVAVFSYDAAGANPATSYTYLSLPPTRFSLASTTTVYFVAKATFSGSTFGAGGIIRARRVR